ADWEAALDQCQALTADADSLGRMLRAAVRLKLQERGDDPYAPDLGDPRIAEIQHLVNSTAHTCVRDAPLRVWDKFELIKLAERTDAPDDAIAAALERAVADLVHRDAMLRPDNPIYDGLKPDDVDVLISRWSEETPDSAYRNACGMVAQDQML